MRAPERVWDGMPAPESVTVPVSLDNDRMFVPLTFRRPDGRERTALAWVNMGMGGLSLVPALRDELGHDGPVSFRVGTMPVVVERGAVLSASADEFTQQLGPMRVEATLPAGVLRQFRVTLDYPARTLTLARPSDTPAPGIAVPVRVSEGTGLISTDAVVDGQRYPVVIDSGAGYSWWRGEAVRSLVARHPDWLRAEGAVGASNQAMVDRSFEQEGTVVRVPAVVLGGLRIRDVGLLGSGPARGGVVGPLVGRLFWDAWGRGAPGPVVGWIGGNVLSRYRLTVNYRNGVTYWLETSPPRTDELDSVGASLIHAVEGYRIGGLVQREGVAPLAGVEPGDELLAVDGQDAASMTRGAVLGALHGQPGDRRRLTLRRTGRVFEVEAAVGAYSGEPRRAR